MNLKTFGLLLQFTVCLFQTFINGQQYKECGGKPADIMFALDSSASIPFKDFQKEINFTQNLIKIFDIGSDKTRVGLVTFSTTVVPVLRVGEFETKAEILEKTNGIQFQGGNTNTAEALSYIRQKGFKATDSKDRPKIAIILTDGQSNNVVRTITEAAKAKTDGITVFVIGIGSQVDEQELEAIATKPLSHYMLKIGNFDALDSIKDELAIKACEVVPVTPAPPTEPMMNDDDVLYGEGTCSPAKPMSIAYAVDTSSIGAENAYFVMVLINRIASRLRMDKQQISLSVLTSSCGLQSQDGGLIDHVHDQKSLQNSLDTMTSASFQSILRDMRQKIQSDKGIKVGFIFLSRPLSKEEFHKSELESRRAKFKKIHIFVVGIGSRLDESQAVGLTVEKNHYMHTDSYDTLYELEGPILYRICKLN
ncbi:cartilage matrix protein-like isoform X1 [Mytilus edulis]|uniref:cartilage matrix protein-like isoform X1 n=1 Tax=Mytilus edulis TaxID=6550 RepID=UPI0039EE331A